MRKTLTAIVLTVLLSSAQALDINQASSAELQALKGIGPQIAEEIIKMRKDKPFTDWQDLLTRVNGLGPVKAAALSEQGAMVKGQKFKAMAADKAAAKAMPADKPAADKATAKAMPADKPAADKAAAKAMPAEKAKKPAQ